MLGVIVTNLNKSAPPMPMLPDAPRKVRVRGRAAMRLRVNRIGSLVALLVGAWMTWVMLRTPLTHSFGADKTARVDAVSAVKGDRLARWFVVRFSYETGPGKWRSGQGTIDMAGDKPPLVGAGIAVKVLSFWPVRHAALKDEGAGIGAYVAGMISLTFCVLAGVLSAVVWIGPQMQRRLIRDGKVAMGRVAQKFVRRRSGLPQRIVWYRFVAENGEMWDARASMSKERYESFDEGQAVAVIYKAGRPWKSVLYEETDYEAV